MLIFSAAVSVGLCSQLDVLMRKMCHTDCGVVHDKQHVRVLRHSVKYRRELGELHLEGMELLTHARARVLQCFDKLTCAFVARMAKVETLGAIRGR